MRAEEQGARERRAPHRARPSVPELDDRDPEDDRADDDVDELPDPELADADQDLASSGLVRT